jgi:ATP synthase protein I
MGADRDRPTSWQGIGIGWAITSELIGGMVVLGGIGYLLDRLFDTDRILIGVGVLLGAALGIYVVWLRYGRGDR